MKIVIIVMILAVFLVGCSETLEKEKEVEKEPVVEKEEDTGIGDVFEDSEDIEPPVLPV